MKEWTLLEHLHLHHQDCVTNGSVRNNQTPSMALQNSQWKHYFSQLDSKPNSSIKLPNKDLTCKKMWVTEQEKTDWDSCASEQIAYIQKCCLWTILWGTWSHLTCKHRQWNKGWTYWCYKCSDLVHQPVTCTISYTISMFNKLATHLYYECK